MLSYDSENILGVHIDVVEDDTVCNGFLDAEPD